MNRLRDGWMDGLMDTLLNGREELDAGITHFVSMCDKNKSEILFSMCFFSMRCLLFNISKAITSCFSQ